jgi:hypothetical protein
MKMTVMEKAVKCWWLAEIVSFFYFCLFKKLFSQIDHRETYFISESDCSAPRYLKHLVHKRMPAKVTL